MQIVTTSPDSHSTVLDQLGIKAVAKDAQSGPIGQDLHLILAADILTNNQTAVLKNLVESLKSGGFLVLEETGNTCSNVTRKIGLAQLGKQTAPGKSYVLMKKLEETSEPIIIQITEKNYSWVEGLKAAMKKADSENHKVLLVSQGEELLGMVGLMTCLRQEAGGHNVRYVFIQDKNAPKFSIADKLYSDQLNKQMMANVLKGGHWGSYRHLRLDQQSGVSSLHVEHAYINALVRGDLSSLRWIEGPLSYYQPEKFPNKEFCSVYFAPLNFRLVFEKMLNLNHLHISTIIFNYLI